MEFDADGAVLIVNGKTGQGRVRLTHSVPRLTTWLEHHPEKEDPKAFLWVSVGSKNNRQRLMHQCCKPTEEGRQQSWPQQEM